ncbi:MAG TPA: cytochrome c-type biogenesis protein CcmH [Terriglobales bacterium]|nr:cytochrome c-type biogenesis protein CcmH [Terriglobales bacterium]
MRVTFIAMLAIGLMGAGDKTQRFEKLGHELICTCGCNQVLLECNHVGCPSSAKMRDELSGGIAKGGDNDAVLQTFVAKYGATVLAAPTTKGFDRVAWIMPFAVFFTGIAAVVLVSRKWKQRAVLAGAMHTNATSTDDLRTRIRQETEL